MAVKARGKRVLRVGIAGQGRSGYNIHAAYLRGRLRSTAIDSDRSDEQTRYY